MRKARFVAVAVVVAGWRGAGRKGPLSAWKDFWARKICWRQLSARRRIGDSMMPKIET